MKNKKKVPAMLPPMPKTPPFKLLDRLKANLMLDCSRFSSGFLGMTIQSATIHETINGKKVYVGDVSLTLSGGIMITDRRGKGGAVTWGFGPKAIWEAFMNTEEEDAVD